jgi:hypothetical protein
VRVHDRSRAAVGRTSLSTTRNKSHADGNNGAMLPSPDFLTIGCIARHERLTSAALRRYVVRQGGSLALILFNFTIRLSWPLELKGVPLCVFDCSNSDSRSDLVNTAAKELREDNLIP